MNSVVNKLLKSQFVKFCIVGALGMVTDMLVLFFVKKAFAVDPQSFLGSLIWLPGYGAAIIQNYLINHFWTFTENTAENWVSFRYLFIFAVISISSLIPRQIVFELVRHYMSPDYFFTDFVANFFGIAAGTVVNFVGSKFIVFKKR